MNRIAIPLFSVMATGAFLGARAAEPEPAPAAEPIVQLPPMVVADTAGSARWLYVKVDGDEYLSRCSKGTTRTFITSREDSLRRLRAIVPDEFLADIPTVTLLQDQDVTPKDGDQIGRELLGTDKAPTVSPTGGRTVKFLPNLRLDDRDVSASFAYLDESRIGQTELVVSASNLRFLLERRTPMLPPWLVEGILATNATLDPRAPDVTLRPLFWTTRAESAAIARNPSRPRALLSAVELFAPDALRGEGNHHPLRVRTLQAQVGLFVRWALDPRNQARDAFWTFARRACTGRVTEEMFTNCFGFGFSDLRDRLNDYLPLALKEPLKLEPAPRRKTAPPEIREATFTERSRLTGRWERLEISYVQQSHPDYAGSYIAQARRTLVRPYETGDHDPGLLAELGLCEIDAGAPQEAVGFLEQAAAAGTNRPRVYYELARLRFAGLMGGGAANRIFSAADMAPVVEPLRHAITLTPLLPEAFGLLADAWLRTREPAPAGDVAALVQGARNFALNPVVSYRLALALARSGHRAEAAELLATGAEYVPDDAARGRYTQLLAALEKGAPAKP
jgi:hypothetical protein